MAVFTVLVVFLAAACGQAASAPIVRQLQHSHGLGLGAANPEREPAAPAPPTVAPAPPPAEHSQFDVVVPAGAAPGHHLIVAAPDGQKVKVVVPEGAEAGGTLSLSVHLPVAPAPAPAPAAPAPAAPASSAAPASPAAPASSAPAGEGVITDALLAPFTDVATEKLPQHSVLIHGTRVKFAVTSASHIALIVGHVKRELHGYALMRDAILADKTRAEAAGSTRRPLVIDVGANHGLYALYAALIGADVIVVEPQPSLCRVINYAAQLNGVVERIELHNNAVLEAPALVDMALGGVAEGAVASVKRGDGKSGATQALPISTLVPVAKGHIAFLKIDVEGFELPALASALPLFEAQRVDHALVEFGPPKRWADAGLNVTDGLSMLRKLAAAPYNLQPRLAQSYAWNAVMELGLGATYFDPYLEGLRLKDSPGTYFPLGPESMGFWPAFMQGMESCQFCESELWLTTSRTAGQAYPTFGPISACVREAGDSNKAHRKPCFVHDLGDGVRDGPYPDAPTKAGSA